MDSYIIKVQPRDELPVIIDKIISTRAKRVYLLVPEESSIARHVINLRLLKREADSLGKDIIVVSKSPRVQALALKASLQVHQETEELKRGAETEPHPYIENVAPKIQDIVITQPSGNGQRKKKQVLEAEKENKKNEESRAKKISLKTRLTGRSEEETDDSRRFIENFWKKRKVPSKPKRYIPALALPSPGILSRMRKIKVARGVMALFVLMSLVATWLTFYSILPSAKIHINTIVDDVAFQLRVKADANISSIQEANLVIPAQVFVRSITKSKTIVTSGEREINERARGIIKVYNTFSSAPQTLVATTRFISEEGKLFRTQKTIVVPGAEVEGGRIIPSSKDVEVVAAESGAEYNIGSSSFSIPGFKGTAKYLAFYGKSDSSMSGGRIASVRVVSRSDYEGAENQLRDELRSAASEEIQISLQEGFIAPKGADSISDVVITSTKSIDEEADEFEMSGAISLKAFVVRSGDVMQLLKGDFESRFEGRRLLLEGQEIDYKILGTDFVSSVLDLQVSYSARAAQNVSGSDIKEGVLGKEEKEVRAFLASYPGISEARVTFWPFWVHNIPIDPSKTEVTIEP